MRYLRWSGWIVCCANRIIPLDDVVEILQVEFLALAIWLVSMLREGVFNYSSHEPRRNDNLVTRRLPHSVPAIDPSLVVFEIASYARPKIVRRRDVDGDVTIIALCAPTILDIIHHNQTLSLRASHSIYSPKSLPRTIRNCGLFTITSTAAPTCPSF